MIPKEVFVALRTDHKSEILITSESNHRVSFIVALKKQLDPSSAMSLLHCESTLIRRVSLLQCKKTPGPVECHVIVAESVSVMKSKHHALVPYSTPETFKHDVTEHGALINEMGKPRKDMRHTTEESK